LVLVGGVFALALGARAIHESQQLGHPYFEVRHLVTTGWIAELQIVFALVSGALLIGSALRNWKHTN